MANAVYSSSLYKFLPHRRKVLSLYKRSIRTLECWCSHLGMEEFSYERTLLRARFDNYKDEKDPTTATHLLRLGEEEFWQNQHHAPIHFPNSLEGQAWQRLDKHRIQEAALNFWHPEERAMLPDYFKNREKWLDIRKNVWADEMKCLEDWDKQNIKEGRSMTDALPAAKEKDGYPPYWWRTVTRPLEKPKPMLWMPKDGDA